MRDAPPPDPSSGQNLAALLRRLRAGTGLGTRRLAKRSALDRRTILLLESGSIRPRRCTLAAVAYGLEPDDQERRKQLLGEMIDAAGGPDALAPDGRWAAYRARRIRRGLLDGSVPLPREIARRLDLNARADALTRQAFELMDQPGAVDDGAMLTRISALLDKSRHLRDEAGGPVSVYIGRKRISAGFAPGPG